MAVRPCRRREGYGLRRDARREVVGALALDLRQLGCICSEAAVQLATGPRDSQIRLILLGLVHDNN